MIKYLYQRAFEELKHYDGLYISSFNKNSAIELIADIQKEIEYEIDFLVHLKTVFEKFPRYQIENTHYDFHIKPKSAEFKERSVLWKILWNWSNNDISEFRVLNLENIDVYINNLKSYLEDSPEQIVDEYLKELY